MGSVGLTRCRPPGLAGFRNVGQWRPLFPSPAFFPHSGSKSSPAPCPGVELSTPTPTPTPLDNSSSSHICNTTLPTILEDDLGNNKENVTDNNAEEYDRAAAIGADLCQHLHRGGVRGQDH